MCALNGFVKWKKQQLYFPRVTLYAKLTHVHDTFSYALRLYDIAYGRFD